MAQTPLIILLVDDSTADRTLYRHFPTREALFQAVYRRAIDQLVDLATTLAAEGKALEALR